MLKKSNKNIFILLAFILIVSLLSIISITPGFKTDLETSLRILLKQPALFFRTNKLHDNSLIDYTYKVFNGLNNRIFNNHSFENIKININFSELQKLQKDRERALKKDKLSKTNTYFEERSKRVKIIRGRSNFNFFFFHFSSSIMQVIRNKLLKFLLKRQTFIEGYLGKIFKI